MIEQLFGSKTRVKLLNLFFENPNRSFYVREITRKVDEQINSVRRELANLLSIGIIGSDASNNRLYYEVNQKYEHYAALAMIFGGAVAPAAPAPVIEDKKSTKIQKPSPAPAMVSEPASEHPIAKDLRTTGHVELAFLTGQFTRDDSAGIDLLVVGDINATKIAKYIDELEKSEKKSIRYTVLTPANYRYRLDINDRFINNIKNAKKQVIIGSSDLPLE